MSSYLPITEIANVHRPGLEAQYQCHMNHILSECDGARPGTTYGRLTILGMAFRLRTDAGNHRRKVVCRCECGAITVPDVACLRSGEVISCGCSRREAFAKRTGRALHGLNKHPLYTIWKGMLARCNCTGSGSFDNYGGRGISVCSEWATDFKAFLNWSLSNGWKKGLEIDRRNNDGNYEPSNCRWVTRVVNANNTRTNLFIEAFGEIKTAAQWLSDARCKATRTTLYRRLKDGWSPERAIVTDPSDYDPRTARTLGRTEFQAEPAGSIRRGGVGGSAK